MNKFRSLVISAIMAAMAIPVAYAAGTPSLNIPANESTQQSVSFNNISSDVKNLQVTINLETYNKEQTYNFYSDLSKIAGVEVFYKQISANSITIYITSNINPLTTTGNINLGTIEANESFKITSATNMKTTDGINSQTPSMDNSTGDNDNSNDLDDSNNSSGSTDSDNSNNSNGSTDSDGSDNSNNSSNGSDNSSGSNNSNGSNSSSGSNNSGNSNNNNSNDNTDNEPENTETTIQFTDVNENDWYYDAVKYVYVNGLMSGVSDTTFAPNANTTRGMIVTVLYRMENQPNVTIDNSFKDVKSTDYYGNAIYWAKQNNIVSGYNSTTFAPNDNITREQMAAILYRYAAYKGYSVDKTSDLSNFNDTSNISNYALTPIKWAVSSGLISGMGDSTISPLGNASRAQIATILMRFIENL